MGMQSIVIKAMVSGVPAQLFGANGRVPNPGDAPSFSPEGSFSQFLRTFATGTSTSSFGGDTEQHR